MSISLLVLWLVSLAFFAATEALPGDFASANATRDTTIEDIDQIRQQHNLYLPVYQRYWQWLQRSLQGDFGRSWQTRKKVGPVVLKRFSRSLTLGAGVALVALPIAMSLAVWSVLRLNTRRDRIVTASSLVGMSIPEFMMAYLLMYLFAVKFQLLPTFTLFYQGTPVYKQLIGLILPVAVLSIATIAPVMRLTRASIINVMSSEYIEMAHRKGLSPRRIVLAHALPNALGPIAQALVLTFSNLLLGMVIIEYIFGYPGIGRLMVDAVIARDVPLMMACTLVFSVAYIFLNLCADLVAVFSNPRLRYPLTSRTVSLRLPSMSRRRALSIAVLAMAFVAASTYLLIRKPDIVRPPVQILAEVKWPGQFPPPRNIREHISAQSLINRQDESPRPTHYDYFLPIGNHGPAHDVFNGELRVPSFEVQRGVAAYKTQHYTWKFPGFRSRFTADGEHLIPHDADFIGDDRNNPWKIILAAGRTWSEPGDNGWSRASFPITLVHELAGNTRNGAATFVFRGNKISNLKIQIAQESNPGSYLDIWGQGTAFYLPAPRDVHDHDVVRKHRHTLSHRIPIKPWSTLEQLVDKSLLQTFDSRTTQQRITMSGLMIDNSAYIKTCRTRLGRYPFCEEMRHSVYSVSKSMGGLVGMLWLAEKFGSDVFDAKIIDYLELNPTHDGWDNVTFGDALDMATGIGHLVPAKVDDYVEADYTRRSAQVYNAQSTEEKLWLIGGDKNYPWGPGEIFRYRTSDTFLLGAAMDAYLKRRQGGHVNIWDSLHQEVLSPLGIQLIPSIKTVEKNPRDSLPLLGWGLLMTFNDTLKISRLLQDGGEYEGQQLLHREMTQRALTPDRRAGLPTGWRYPEGGEARYSMSLWRAPHFTGDCATTVPYMSGYSGNYVLLLPKRMVAVRFADGNYNSDDTWDHWDMRNVANTIKNFCDTG